MKSQIAKQVALLVICLFSSSLRGQTTKATAGFYKTGGGTLTLLANTKLEKATFLGVTTSRASAALRENLRLDTGVGLVVESVEKGSPAEAAGIAQYDILQKFNDQILVNPDQLGALVRLAKAGEEVKLTLIHKGQSSSAAAKLIEKEVRVSVASDSVFPNNSYTLSKTGVINFATPTNMNTAISVVKNADGEVMIYKDPQAVLELSRRKEGRYLSAKSPSGKQLFLGLIETEEQRKALPAEIAEKLQVLDKQPTGILITDQPIESTPLEQIPSSQ